MIDDSISYKRLVFAVSAALAVGTAGGGCGGGSTTPPGDDDVDAPVTPPGSPVLKNPSRSSTIAITDDNTHVAMVNPDDGSLSIFQTSDNARTAKVATGSGPAGVVLAPDNKTAYVSNRNDGTVVRITGIDTGTPTVDKTIQVGAEPIGLALSPTGAQLFVAEYAESRVSVIDTATMTIAKSLPADRPRALLVTNNADASDADETLVVANFFGSPVAGKESKDDGRAGHVHLYALADLTQAKDITLAAIDSGFPKGGVAGNPTVHASANQLGAIATANGKLYITSVAASPEGPNRFDNNVFPVVYVADIASATEVTGAAGTTNLARKIVDATPNASPTDPRFIPGDLSDIAFVEQSNVAYAIGRAGDVMVRATFGATVDIGSTQNKEIDLGGSDALGKCQGPIGLAIDSSTGHAYVNCWITRKMAVVDLSTQAMTATFEAAAPPSDGLEIQQLRGKRFYFTGRARWSAAEQNGGRGGEGWSSCGSCHPDGLSDNITWSFGAGPRQTVSQDGTFSHGTGAQKQRILNHTGIFDEHHDFERNVRDVSGGLGVITTAATAADCGKLDKETQVSLQINGANIGGLAKPLKELADDPTVATCGHKDWDDVEAFVKSIAPVHAKKATDTASVARGKQLFVDGGCAKCHGGAGWTVSRLFYTPASATNTALGTSMFTRPTFFPQTWIYDNNGSGRGLISAQPIIATADPTGPAEPAAVAVGQTACTLRNVGTFGVPNDTAATDALEFRIANGASVRAEGRGGYNVPSLYGLALGAPYLHHGQASTLPELFSDTRWQFHTNAGNANFSVTLAQAGKLDDLVGFLFSIDAATPEIAVPTDPNTGASFDACPLVFP